MPRVARITIPGVAHHITQRGNNRQQVFFVDDDRGLYLELLRRESKAYGLRLLGYCLMRNHLHLVGVPQQAHSLAKAVGRTHLLYTQYINRLHGRSGHLWQGRFFSCALDDAHCWAALCYIERNPVRAGLVRRAWEYEWSSAAVHCGRQGVSELLDLPSWRKVWDSGEWKSCLRRREDAEQVSGVRLRTRTGRPLGADAFISKVERLAGRRLRPLPIGRPRKPEGDKTHGKNR
jgi:putative transposase